jgi:hypothetical protein
MKPSEHKLNTLLSQYPDACLLIADIVKTIDHERKQETDDDCIKDFELDSIGDVVNNTIENLSMSDATSVESDHALSVMATVFNILCHKSNLSMPSTEPVKTTDAEPKTSDLVYEKRNNMAFQAYCAMISNPESRLLSKDNSGRSEGVVRKMKADEAYSLTDAFLAREERQNEILHDRLKHDDL